MVKIEIQVEPKPLELYSFNFLVEKLNEEIKLYWFYDSVVLITNR